jgi:di/tricarboxylate transporter
MIAVTAFYLYTRPKIKMEMVALLLLLALALLFHFFPLDHHGLHIGNAEILSGFGHPVLIAILSLMILGRGLLMTGALEPLVRALTRLWKRSPAAGLLLTLVFGVMASAFINDTPVLVMMMPMLLGVAERTGTSASKTLMPLNFAILGGGIVTSLGTSTNLLVISIAADLGVRQIGLFDFTRTSAVALLVAIPYLWLVAPRLLPAHSGPRSQPARNYESKLQLEPGSSLVGRTVGQAQRRLGRTMGLVHVVRGGVSMSLDADFRFAAGDELVMSETPAGLREIATVFAATLYDRRVLDHLVAQQGTVDDIGVAELVIGPKSPLCGSTVRDARFGERFGVAVIALHRSDTDLLRPSSGIGNTRLQAGDLLLVQGTEPRLESLRSQWDLMMLDSRLAIPRTPLAPWALGIMAGVVLLAAFRVLPIHLSALVGVAAMLLTGCVKFEGVGRALSLEVVLLVASSVALSLCLVGSGAADWLASGAVLAVRDLPPALQVAAMMSLSAILTNFVSNSASAAIGTPIAVTMANQLALPAEPFVLAILYGANLSYATPMAYQTNLLVMKAAGYTFRDFAKVGVPLVLLMLATLSWLLVRRYGL